MFTTLEALEAEVLKLRPSVADAALSASEAMLRASGKRKAFLPVLSDALRPRGSRPHRTATTGHGRRQADFSRAIRSERHQAVSSTSSTSAASWHP